uniref:M24 family metallopeptidase C-terminal domain-containing protein n=1 Tax=uncultured Maritalea sp. TaxID=757249 RepID=UPI0026081324
DGFANSYHVMHGLNVCDAGLSVENAGATVNRAETLGAHTFQQAIAPGELDIPAIRGVGGGLLHFVDDISGLRDVWDVEFRPIEDDTAPVSAGLTRIDHLAQTMAFDELLTCSLFYISLFEVTKSSDGYLQFETLSMIPIGLGPVLREKLNDDEISWLNAYHELVHEKLAPMMPNELLPALKAATAPL